MITSVIFFQNHFIPKKKKEKKKGNTLLERVVQILAITKLILKLIKKHDYFKTIKLLS